VTAQRCSDVYEAALARLPEAYALVLRLTAAGVADDDVCRRLGIDLESLEPLREVAKRKLRKELSRA